MKDIFRSVWIWSCEHILYYPIIINHSLIHNHYNVGGERIPYLVIPQKFYGNVGERTIEVAFAKSFLARYVGKKVLEVGNVMSGYTKIDLTNHLVLDKYEKGANIINKDIIDLKDVKKYDAILSVSTMEHVGYDETPRTKGKAIEALRKMMRALKPHGEMLVTVPIGHNPEIDQMLRSNSLKFNEVHFLKRISALNSWAETSGEDALSKAYGGKYPAANAVAFLIYRAP